MSERTENGAADTQPCLILRIGEIFLKGKNIGFFEKLLKDNIQYALTGVRCRFEAIRSRYLVRAYDVAAEDELIDRITRVFGLTSVSPARECPATVEAIAALAVRESRRSGTFRVNVNRADKKFPLHSNALCVELGGRLLSAYPDLRVDLHRPDFTVEVDIREGGRAFVFSRRIPCAGGMPVGSAGLGALMLSGGIDSPVAGHMMAKRGLKLFAVHFHSFPYTSEAAKEKVVALTKILTRYVGSMELVVVPFTAIQEAIHLKCDASFMITIMRRVMMRIACRLAAARGAGAVVTGESLGQVASQTMQSMTVTTAVATLPVFRPVIGMDKDEIVERARAIGSFETSILPYADCCTVFLPPNPQTKPDQARTEFVESKLENLEELIAAAIAAAESIRVKGID